MAEETNIQETVKEIKNADEESLQKVIERWFETTRTSGMKIGATYISAGVYGVIQKHTRKKNGAKASLRDYQRMTDDIIKIVSVQLAHQNTQQNYLKDNEDNNSEYNKEENVQ